MVLYSQHPIGKGIGQKYVIVYKNDLAIQRLLLAFAETTKGEEGYSSFKFKCGTIFISVAFFSKIGQSTQTICEVFCT